MPLNAVQPAPVPITVRCSENTRVLKKGDGFELHVSCHVGIR